jgi:murein DD-endopeptidase MepM/ murein hydrolase activator NlpD
MMPGTGPISHGLARGRIGWAAAICLVIAAAGLAWAGGLTPWFGLSPQEKARRALAEERASMVVEHAAFTGEYGLREARTLAVTRGETLGLLLRRAGASGLEAERAVRTVALTYNPRDIRPDQEVTVYFENAGAEAQLQGLSFRSEPGAAITVNRLADGEFRARQVFMPVTFEVARVAATIESSLYQSALAGGATDREVSQLADVFAYDVDFQRDIFPGDKFEIVFERFRDDEGRTVKTGDLLFVSLDARGKPKSFYRFQAPGDAQPDWYNPEGKSARKFLMKTPINGARLSSGFGMRRHPILGYSKLHKGVDFAAPTGTPIMAAGDGVLVKVGILGGYGNYVRVRHLDGYETAYAHMSRFARNMRAGVRVSQGQVIGYVGSTGRSTGPHLHYEVLYKGAHINPMSLRVPTGRNLAGEALKKFNAEKDRIDALRAAQGAIIETPKNPPDTEAQVRGARTVVVDAEGQRAPSKRN